MSDHTSVQAVKTGNKAADNYSFQMSGERRAVTFSRKRFRKTKKRQMAGLHWQPVTNGAFARTAERKVDCPR